MRLLKLIGCVGVMLVAVSSVLTPQAHGGVMWVGREAPALSIEKLLNAPPGTPLTLDRFAGRTVVIEFFSIECPKCMEAMPHFNELARSMKNEPITFIALTNEDERAVRAWLSENPMSAYVGLDPDWSMWVDYAVPGVPLAVVINPNGVIAALVHPNKLDKPMLQSVMSLRTPAVELTELYTNPSAPESQANKALPLMQVEVRPATPGARMAVWQGEEFRARAITLADLLSLAFGIESYKFVSDDLLLDARYDVSITPPTGDEALVDEMLKSIVVQMARPQFREVEREVPVYVLRSRPASAMNFTRGEGAPSIKGNDGHVIATNVPIGQIVGNLQRDLRAPVIDETKLDGGWDFEMEWDVSDPQSLLRALREQLGLDVRREMRPMKVYQVKRAE